MDGTEVAIPVAMTRIVSIGTILLLASLAAAQSPTFEARVAQHTRRLAQQMRRADTTQHQQFYDVGDEAVARAVVQRLLKHPAFVYGGGRRRASMDGRGDKAIFRTSDPQTDKLELLRRLSWRNHSVDLWATNKTIVFGGTNTGVEMGILKRGDRFTYLIGSSNSVSSYAMEARHGRLMLHTHPGYGTSRGISQPDLYLFAETAKGMTSRTLEPGKNVQMIASYPSRKKDSPADWFRNVDIYVWATDLPKNVALLPNHPVYERVMQSITGMGFKEFNRPRGIVANPASTESVAF